MVLQDGLGIYDSILGTPVLPLSYPDRKDPVNQLAGFISRVGAMMPERDEARTEHFEAYATAFIMTLPSLGENDVPNLLAALAKTSYNKSWQEYLAQIRDANRHWNSETDLIKMFIKLEPSSWGVDAEGTEIPGEPRCINAQSAIATSLLLPLFQEIDKVIFNHDGHKYFVKGMAPRAIPKLLIERMGSGAVMTNDFSSFEAHHTGVYARILFKLFMHMIRRLPNKKPLKALLHKMTMGVNRIKGFYFSMVLLQRMMSGVLWTSSGNGFLNLLFMSYISQVKPGEYPDVTKMVAWTRSSFSGVVEGDDSIMPLPDAEVADVKTIVAELGLNAKIEIFESVDRAGFCGVQCDTKSMVSVRDPIKAIRKAQALPMKFLDSSAKVHKAYLRGVAISGKDIAGDTPIYGAYCDWVLAQTRGYDTERYRGDLDTYQRDTFDAAVKRKIWQMPANVSTSSRGLVEELYGIPVALQIDIEERIRNSAGKLELPISLFMSKPQIAHSAAHLVPVGRAWAIPENPKELIDYLIRGINARIPESDWYVLDGPKPPPHGWAYALQLDGPLRKTQFNADDAAGVGA